MNSSLIRSTGIGLDSSVITSVEGIININGGDKKE